MTYSTMPPNAYTVRYSALLLFYFGVNFILFLIVKNDDMKIFVPKVNNTKLKYVKKPVKDITNFVYKHSESLVTDICNNYNVSKTIIRRNFLYDENYKTLYCWIRKVASTSFTKLFSDMNKRHVTGNYYKEMNYLMPKNEKTFKKAIKDKNVYKFVVVRHPFERLVSSYRDRIEDNSKYTAQAWIFARQIFQLTRPHLMKGNETTGNSIHQIFDEQKRLKIVPSFAEFIKWLLQQNPSKDDPHWSTFTDHCQFCKINYNKIFRLENNQIKDLNLLFENIGLVNNRNIDLLNLEETNNGLTHFKQACQYFKELTKAQILQLYVRYKVDFKMFQYNYRDYIKCALDYN